MWPRIKWGIIIALVVGLAVMGWLYRAEIKQSANLAQQVIAKQMQVNGLNSRLVESERQKAVAERIAADHQAKLKRIAKQARGLRNEIRKLEAKNPKVKAWADAPVPADVVAQLRDGTHTD